MIIDMNTSTPSPDTTRLCLIRHGETDWNLERRLQGQTDIPLNTTGLQQAEALARGFPKVPVDALYCSDLQRARQTAAPLLDRLRCPQTLNPALREQHYGVFQGHTYAEMAEKQPELYARYRARDPQWEIPQGESIQRFYDRVTQALAQIAAQHQGQTLVVVTHGGVLDMLWRHAHDYPLAALRQVEIPNAAFNWVSWQQGRWQVEQWAVQDHLAAALDELT